VADYLRQNLAAGLYLVGVPIGTARDITLRALDTLASADLLAAEDTRSLRRLLEIHGVPLAGRKIISLHDHSKEHQIQALIGEMAQGKSLAYTSEAGMPLIADPGFELVNAARKAELYVTSAPGPSAVPTSLALAGLASDAFHFAGFLPNTQSARRKALSALKPVQATLVLFESPARLATALKDAAEVLGARRQAAICRELTKKFEEIIQGELAELASLAQMKRYKGEIVLLITRDRAPEINEIEMDQMILSALETLSVKDAAAFVSEATGEKKRSIYQKALALAAQRKQN
jgi:16S rRNA (cytidine1402-2'-O)-methyltransferase